MVLALCFKYLLFVYVYSTSEIVGKTQIIHRKLSGRLTLSIVSKSGYVLLFIFHKHRHAKFR